MNDDDRQYQRIATDKNYVTNVFKRRDCPGFVPD